MELWILDPAPIMGGGQAFALRLARHLRDRGVVLVCPESSELAERARDAGVAVRTLELPALTLAHPVAVARAIRATRRLLASAGPDVLVVANHPRAHAYVAAARRLRRHPPVVLVAHDQESAARRSARFVYRRFGTLVAIGANAAATYESALPGVRVRRVNNFLLDAPSAAPPEGVRPPVIGVLARMIREKGILELVDELAQNRDEWRLLRVAAGPEDPEYVAEVEARLVELRLGARAELLGQVSDVPGFLSGIDVLVAPSVGPEVQPTVILEALAAGRPVVVRRPLWSPDFEGLPVSPYDDGADLAAALAQAAALPVPPWSELRARFGPDQVVEGLEDAASARS